MCQQTPRRVVNPDRRTNESERGSYLIEASLTTLLMFGLLFLVVDLSLVLFTQATLENAVREGVRFAVTDQLATNQSYLNDSIKQVVQQHALGMLNGANGACKIAINYYNPVTGLPDSGTGGDVVEVSVVGYSYAPIGVMKSSSPMSITASSSDVMESCPLAGCPPASNPSPPACP